MPDLRSKYIVPFSFCSTEYNKLHEQSESWIIEDKDASESDIYEYVQNSFITSNNIESVNSVSKIACLYRYVGDCLPPNFKLKYINNGKYRYFYIREVHVALFQTGIGLLWFIPELSGKCDDIDEIIEFTYNLKELARNEKSNCVFKESIETLTAGENITNEQLLPDGKRYKKDAHFFIGEWVDDITKTISKDIIYYPSRTRGINDSKRVLPDKAVLFHCGTIEKREDSDQCIVYLSRGYKRSYKLIENLENEIFQPFDNVKCYASSEGCGYFGIIDGNAHAFFSDLQKVSNDYFLLYLLALYQTYTLLRYSELIATKLSANDNDYCVYSKDLEDNLDEIMTGLNVFLAKSVYSSVSHVQQQNEFFNYISQRLLIKENIASVSAGIDALNNIESNLYEEEMQKRNHFLEGCLTIVSLLAVLSAFNDGNDFVRNYAMSMFAPDQPIEIYAVNIILMIIALIVIGLLFKYLIYKPNRKLRKKRK